MVDRDVHAHTLAIDKYQTGGDFDQWVIRFEMAVGLAHQVNEPDKRARKERLCMEWLPLKLDDATFTIFCDITAATWSDMKTQLGNLLTDPQEKYARQERRRKNIWGNDVVGDKSSCLSKKLFYHQK